MRSQFLVVPFLVFVGCGSDGDGGGGNASVQAAAEETSQAGAVTLQPGKWKVSSVLQDISIAGMPPEAVAAAKSEVGKSESYNVCLTPEEAKKPAAEFFTGGDKSCRYDHFSLLGGKVDAKMRCEEDGSTMTMMVAGSYSSDRYSTRITMDTSGEQAGMKMVMKADAARIGQCDGSEEG